VQGTKLELSLKESSKMDLSAIPNEFIASALFVSGKFPNLII